MLLETVRDEQNPKFKNSAFMGLMQQLRDREVTVDGNTMVAVDNVTSYAPGSSSSKGKGRAVEPVPFAHTGQMPSSQPPAFLPQVNLPQENDIDAYLRQENEEYTSFWKQVAETKSEANPTATEWDHLQADWDQFEATNTGVRQLDPYQFQYNNPYLLGDSTRTRLQSVHDGDARLAIFEVDSTSN